MASIFKNVLFFTLCSVVLVVHASQVNYLRAEYLVDPQGMDCPHPRLSWVIDTVRQSEKQTAYQVLVASSEDLLKQDKGDLWDSGKVVSNQSNQLEYAGKDLASRGQCFWKVRIWDVDGAPTAWSDLATWTMGLLKPADWQAKWIGLPPKGDEPPPPRYLRQVFLIKSPIKRATVYTTALGLYELHLNGLRVGDHLLAPEWTNYEKRVQYQTYDVTSLLSQGQNCLGVILGNGWYCGNWQFWKRQLHPIYGAQPYFLLQLEVEFADGTRQTVTTDSTWRGTANGPIRFSGIYEGETYDARMEMPGWDTTDYKPPTAWQSVTVASPKIGPLIWQRSEPIRRDQELKSVSVNEPKPGHFVFDLGQNIAGWPRLHLHEPAGTQITLQANEVIKIDGTVYLDDLHLGHLSTTGDRQVIHYTCKGGDEVYEPHFTYMGFRYVEITGLTQPPTVDLVTGCVFHTGFTPCGTFTCSSDLVNKLAQNIQWSQRDNMMGIPTNCDQRDERDGDTGSMDFFCPTAVYNFDMAAFCNKWLVDLCDDSQQPGGWFADHAPFYGPAAGPNVGWSDAGIIVPYNIYQTYGDTRVIRDHYAAMQHCLAWINANSDNLLHKQNVGNGDLLDAGGNTPTSKPVIGTAYDAYDFRLMSEMAAAIGKSDDAAKYAKQADLITTAFQKAFINDKGQLKESGQTGYALAFSMDLVPQDKEEKMADAFANDLGSYHNFVTTGVIGTPRLLPALHAAGLDDLAYVLLLNEDYPSWLYEVNSGATTTWERWNSVVANKGFADPAMNSFNAYSQGSVGEYLFGYIGGIQAETPGYKKIRIAPVIQPDLSWAKARYDSIAGTISSEWKVEGNTLTLDVTIPATATATVCIPSATADTVMENGVEADKILGIKFIDMEDKCAVYEVQSGKYEFVTVAPPR